MMDAYLLAVFEEATRRGYKFSHEKLGSRIFDHKLAVTDGQLRYELSHLRKKLITRDKRKYDEIANVRDPEPHPIFHVIPGGIEAWERLLSDGSQEE
jgi:hypothetical protein